MKIVVLGGAGAMAQVIVRDLTESPGVTSVGIADISYEAAEQFAKLLPPGKVSAIRADVRDAEALRRIISPFEVVVNATWYQFNLQVMEAAIQAGVHYADLGGLYHMTLRQLGLDAKAKDAGITCILGIGSTPGTMNVMAAYGASKVDRIDKVKLRSGSAVVGQPAEGFQSPYSFRTVLDEFALSPVIIRQGRIQEVPPLSGKERFVLPEPVNQVEGYYTLHSELATLPRTLDKGVQEMDFIVAYPPEFTNMVSRLVQMGLASREAIKVRGVDVVPYEFLTAVVDAHATPSPELDVDVQRVELEGELAGKPMKLRYDSIGTPHKRWNIGGGTVGTGVPPSVAAQWLASGRIRERGVLPPESCIDPLPFFEELGARDHGIQVIEYTDKRRVLSGEKASE